MKKLNRLFAILIAVLGVGSLSAQTDVTSTYLTNAGFDDETSFVTNGICTYAKDCSANGTTLSGMQPVNGWTFGVNNGDALASGAYAWGAPHFLGGGGYTIPTTDESGNSTGGALGVCAVWNASLYYYQDVTLPSGVYEFTYSVYNSGTGANSIDANLFGFVANNGSSFYGATKTFKANSWTTETVSFVLTAETKGKISVGIDAANAGSGSSHHLFVDCVKLIRKSFTDVTEANPVDLTSMAGGNWLLANGNTAGTTGTSACGGLAGVSEAYQWGNCLAVADNVLTKSLSNLPSGLYTLEIYCASSTTSGRDNANYKVNDGDEQYVTLTANDKSVAIPTYNRTSVESVPVLTLNDVKVTDGNLKLAVNIKVASPNWLMAKVKTIKFIGPDKSLEEANFNNNVTALKALSTENIPTAFATKITNLIDTYGSANASTMTLSQLVTANGEIKDVTDAHSGIATAFGNLTSLIELCTEYTKNSNANSTDVLTTFQTAISTATTDGNAATNADAINAAYNTLESARQTYAQNAAPVYPYGFDMTFLVVNPKFDEGTKGWTSNTSSWSNTIATNQGGAITGNYYENWNESSYTGEIYQQLENLPKGKYVLTAAAFRDQLTGGAVEGDAVYVFANDQATLVTSATPEFYSVEVSTTTGTLKFGVKSVAKVYKWMGIDNVTLQYVEALDLSEFIAAYNAALEAAEAARDNAEYFNITGQERTALEEAINNVPEENQDALSAATVALQSATAAFTAVKADYDLLATEKQTAKGLGMSDDLITTTIGNNTASVALLDLREAEYDYVTKEFSYPVELEANGWIPEGPVGSLTGQHYDGSNSSSYLEQSSSAWGSSAWEISYKYEKTLPAGKYIFKVAGRRAAGTGTTMGLTVTNVNNSNVLGSVNDFPEGDTGLGINKKGKTSFDANDPEGFANNGAGRGWQWRYVMFELSSETTVQVAVNAAATTSYQWMSFCGASLQMTEETYLDANKGGLDAPTAAAQALVNAVPMGAEEIEALEAALSMTYTTGAELLAKIEALETAVANAKAWVGEYNNAKAPLVAALERFEADYNDAQNGALNHMNKGRWATAISMAQAAAVAKDVTDSYDGFATSTENLVAALDAAQASVDEYAALNEAINNANTLYNGGNWGNQPFQKSADTKEKLNTEDAQTVYNAATADGEDVTSVTATLNEAVTNANELALNAPAEGARYNMVIDYAGWEHHGKAVTYLAGARQDAGLYNIQYYAYPNANYAQAFTFTAVEGQTNCYTLSMTDVEGNERYVCTGAVYGGNAGQLRTTTEADKALAVKVIATATDGIHQLWNTEANNYIGGQDAGFFTVDSHTTFRLQEAAKANVTLTLSKVGWATLILPFDAELPEGVKAYSCGEADGETLTLVEAESLKANTPYLMNGQESTHEFSGYGLADKDSYTDGLFVGTYVDYQTTVDGKTYVLQNQNNNLAFYLVTEDAQPWIRANRCYMVYEGAAGAPKFSLGHGEGTTSIDKAQLTIDNVVIYDLMGRKVSTMEKGGVYIVNGKKVVIK